MSNKVTAIVCNCELDNGYIFKHYFSFNSLRGRPVITFLNDRIIAENRTADDQLYGVSTIHGDEINLTWDESIPEEQRKLSLMLDATRLQGALGKIKKKDPARIVIVQSRDAHNATSFSGQGSSDDFIVYVSCGTGGEGREGLKGVQATRTKTDDTIIIYPEKNNLSLLVIPIRSFRSMIDSFTKCKKESITMKFYTNSQIIDDKEVKGRPGIVVVTDGTSQSGPIFEKFGEVPENVSGPSASVVQLGNLNIDETAIVRMAANGTIQPIIEIEKVPEPNEYIFNADKIPIFAKMASMHNEGNVRIYYQKGCHLRIAHRFGAFGECELFLYNPHVKFDPTHESQTVKSNTVQNYVPPQVNFVLPQSVQTNYSMQYN